MEIQHIIEILNSDELNVKSEQAVFDSILRWIDYKPDERKKVLRKQEIIYSLLNIFYKNIVDLLQCVRLGLLTTNFFIEKVKSHPYIINNEACKPLVIDTLKYLYELDVDTYQVSLLFFLLTVFIYLCISKGFIGTKSISSTTYST